MKNHTNLKRGVVKFLKSVEWDKKKTSNEAIKLLAEWDIDPENALFLLSVKFCANNIYGLGIAKDKCKIIRDYAVKSLNKSSTDNLQFILLQLV